MNVQYESEDWLAKIQAAQQLSSSGANEEGLSITDLFIQAGKIIEDAEDAIAKYDKDSAINLEVSQYPQQYPEWGNRMDHLSSLVTKVPDELSASIDYPFLQGMDKLMEGLSNLDINSQHTAAKITIPNPDYSANGMDRNPNLTSVTLSDLLNQKSPLGIYLKDEYAKIKAETGSDITYQQYKDLAFASTAFEYYSFDEQKDDFAISVVVNGAVMLLGGALPTAIGVALNLVSGGVNMYGAVTGTELGSGEKLSTSERIMRGVFGTLEIGIAGYAGVKGFKSRVKTPEKVPEAEVPKKASGSKIPDVEIKSPLGKNIKKHISKHDYETFKNQADFLSDSQLAQKLEKK